MSDYDPRTTDDSAVDAATDWSAVVEGPVPRGMSRPMLK